MLNYWNYFIWLPFNHEDSDNGFTIYRCNYIGEVHKFADLIPYLIEYHDDPVLVADTLMNDNYYYGNLIIQRSYNYGER